MGKHVEVIGVDHGWSGMKTVSQMVLYHNS